MRIPLQVENIKNASGCQMYVTDASGMTECFVKRMHTKENIHQEFNRKSFDLEDKLWDTDCQGDIEKCFFITAFFEDKDKSRQNKNKIDAELYLSSNEMNKKDNIIRIKLLNKASDLCRIKADGMLLPSNIFLDSINPYINKYSKNEVAKKFNVLYQKRKSNLKMGDVIGINDDTFPTKNIFFGIISGETWVVSPPMVGETVYNFLIYADEMGYSTVAITPFDCGELPLDVSARQQLDAVNKLLKCNTLKNIKKIVFCIEAEPSNDEKQINKTYKYFLKEYNQIF